MNTRHLTRWPNIKPTLGQRLIFAGTLSAQLKRLSSLLVITTKTREHWPHINTCRFRNQSFLTVRCQVKWTSIPPRVLTKRLRISFSLHLSIFCPSSLTASPKQPCKLETLTRCRFNVGPACLTIKPASSRLPVFSGTSIIITRAAAAVATSLSSAICF